MNLHTFHLDLIMPDACLTIVQVRIFFFALRSVGVTDYVESLGGRFGMAAVLVIAADDGRNVGFHAAHSCNVLLIEGLFLAINSLDESAKYWFVASQRSGFRCKR